MEFIQFLIYHAQKRGKLSVRGVTNSEGRSVKLGVYRRKGGNTKPHLPPAPYKARLVLSPRMWAA